MLRNYLAAALRNLARNRIYTVLNISGLAIGLAAVLLITLFVRHEFTYDEWLPGHERVYRIAPTYKFPGREPDNTIKTMNPDIGLWIRNNLPQAQYVARLFDSRHVLGRGDIELREKIFWADAETFKVLPLPVLYGDLPKALERPDGIVLTRSKARTYFGRESVLGETLQLDRRQILTIAAVIEDLPSNTSIQGEIFGSGRNAASPLARFDAMPPGIKGWSTAVYMRARPGATVDELNRGLAALPWKQIVPTTIQIEISLSAAPLSTLRLEPERVSMLYAFMAIGALTLLMPCINFVNLMTARAARRGVEVAIRKVAGAQRSDLIAQFMGEALIYVLVSMAMGIALVELVLPGLNAFLGSRIEFAYWRDGPMLGALAAFTAIATVAAGCYPALVLAAFKPAAVFKSNAPLGSGGSLLRQTLVTLQFAVLIGLMLAAGVIYLQSSYAVHDSMRIDTDQVVIVETKCRSAFKDEVAKLAGVLAAACSSHPPLGEEWAISTTRMRDGSVVSLFNVSVEPEYFQLYGLKPLAGRVFGKELRSDTSSADVPAGTPTPIVINETAARKLGFASASAALGQEPFTLGDPERPARVVGVVPDYPVTSIRDEVYGVFYHVDPARWAALSIKLRGQDIPGTLDEIDRLWKRYGEPAPINRYFVNDYIERFYHSMTRLAQLFAAFFVVAVCIACLGLLGLSAFTAERRTKEIGIRKAMGADRDQIVRLLLWQFTRPVLWANAIAWPVAYFLMSGWLRGFVYRIELELWMFAAAGAAAVVIAWLTVVTHAVLVASNKPVSALRYE